MCFHWLTLQRFDQAKKYFLPKHRFASALRHLLLNHPFDNSNKLRLRKPECHYILFYSSF